MITSRWSLSALMLLIAVLAVDIVAFRFLTGQIADPSGQGRRGAYGVLGVLPMLTVFAVDAASLAATLRNRGTARPFASGFLVASLAAALSWLVLGSFWDLPRAIFFLLQPIAPLVARADPTTRLAIFFGLYSLAASVPQFLVALGGGWLFRYYGVGLQREPAPGRAEARSADSSSPPASLQARR